MAKGKKTGGRVAGTPNKLTSELKDMILEAAHQAGGAEGTIGYLKTQATESPAAFLSLLGKVLPLQVSGDPENPVSHKLEIAWMSRKGS